MEQGDLIAYEFLDKKSAWAWTMGSVCSVGDGVINVENWFDWSGDSSADDRRHLRVAQERVEKLQKEEQVIVQEISVLRKEMIQHRMKAEENAREAQERLDSALRAVQNIESSHLREMRSYRVPPQLVKETLAAVLRLLDQLPTPDSWENIQKAVRNPNFVNGLITFDPKNEHTGRNREIMINYLSNPNMRVDLVYQASRAAGPMLQWIFAKIGATTATEELRSVDKEVEGMSQKIRELSGRLEIARKQTTDATTEANHLKEVLGDASVLSPRMGFDFTGTSMMNDDAPQDRVWSREADAKTLAILASSVLCNFGPEESRTRVLSENELDAISEAQHAANRDTNSRVQAALEALALRDRDVEEAERKERELSDEHAKKIKELEVERSDSAALRKKMDEVEKENEFLRRQQKENEKSGEQTAVSVDRHIKSLESQLRALKATEQKLHDCNQSLATDLKKAEAECANLSNVQNELLLAQKIIDEQRVTLEKEQVALRDSRGEVDRLKKLAAHHENELDELREEVSARDSEREEATKKLADSDATSQKEVAKLRAELATAVRKLQENNDLLAEKSLDDQRMAKQTQALRQLNDDLIHENKSLRDSIKDHQDEVDRIKQSRTQSQGLERRMSMALEDKSREIERAKRDASATVEEKIAEIEALRRQLNTAQQQKKEADASSQENEHLFRKARQEYETKVGKLEMEKAALQRKVEFLTDEKSQEAQLYEERLDANARELAERTKEHEAESEALRRQIDELQTELSTVTDELVATRGAMSTGEEDHMNERDKLKKELQETAEKLAKCEADLKAQAAEQDEAEKQHAAQVAELESEKERRDERLEANARELAERTKEHEAESEALRRQIDELQTELSTVTDELVATRGAMSTGEEDHMNERDKLKKELQETAEKLAKCEADLKAQAAEQDEAEKQHAAQVAELEEDIAAVVGEMDTERSSLQGMIDELMEANRACEARIEKQRVEIEDLKEENEIASAELKVASRLCEEKDDEILRTQSHVAALQQQVTDIGEDALELDKLYAEVTGERDQARAALETAKIEKSFVANELEALREVHIQEVASLQRDLAESRAEQSILERELKEQTERMRGHVPEDELNELQHRLDKELNYVRAVQAAAVDQHNQIQRDQKSHIEDLLKTIERLREANEKVEQRSDELQGERDGACVELQQARLQLAATQNQNKMLSDALQEAMVARVEAQQQMDALIAECDDLKQQLDQNEAVIASLSQELDVLQREMDASKSLAEEQQKTIEQIQAENDELRALLKSKVQELEDALVAEERESRAALAAKDESHEARIVEMQSDLHDLASKLAECYRQQVASADEFEATVKRLQREKRETNEKFLVQLEAAWKAAEEARSQQRVSAQEARVLSEENEALRMELDELQRIHEADETNMNETTENIMKLHRQQIAALRAERDHAIQRQHELEEELVALRYELRDLQSAQGHKEAQSEAEGEKLQRRIRGLAQDRDAAVASQEKIHQQLLEAQNRLAQMEEEQKAAAAAEAAAAEAAAAEATANEERIKERQAAVSQHSPPPVTPLNFEALSSAESPVAKTPSVGEGAHFFVAITEISGLLHNGKPLRANSVFAKLKTLKEKYHTKNHPADSVMKLDEQFRFHLAEPSSDTVTIQFYARGAPGVFGTSEVHVGDVQLSMALLHRCVPRTRRVMIVQHPGTRRAVRAGFVTVILRTDDFGVDRAPTTAEVAEDERKYLALRDQLEESKPERLHAVDSWLASSQNGNSSQSSKRSR